MRAKDIVLNTAPKRLILLYIFVRRVFPLCILLANTRRKHGRCYILIATPSHGNLGDQAIVYAQRKLLEKKGLGKQVVEFSNEFYCDYASTIARFVDNDDVIVIDGGGNMGSLWPDNEIKMQSVVTRFPNNRIVIFPNTMYYSDSSASEKLLEKSRSVYNNHPSIYMMARDYDSYCAMQRNYPLVHTFFSPDIVLSLLIPSLINTKRNGVMLCFREDRERETHFDAHMLKAQIEHEGFKSGFVSTLIAGGVNQKNRQAVLYSKFHEFASYQAVITDRLHAMIFCALTGTPCVAIDNTSKKVSGVYQWISYLPYVVLISEQSDVLTSIKQVIEQSSAFYRSPELEDAFRVIEEMM